MARRTLERTRARLEVVSHHVPRCTCQQRVLTALGWPPVEALSAMTVEGRQRSASTPLRVSKITKHISTSIVTEEETHHDKGDGEKNPVTNLGVKIKGWHTCGNNDDIEPRVS